MRKQEQWLALLVSAAFLGGCSGGSNDATPATNLVGGAISSLAGSGLILSLNGADLAVGANGTFIFPTGLASGTGYTVSVKAQPVVPHQTCLVTNATGTMGDSAVSNISVACTTNSYTVRGTVAGLTGSGLTLRLSPSVSLPVSANGDFTFPEPLVSGSNYTVAVSRQPQTPFQTCVAANATGVIGGSDTNITVTCKTDMFSVGGTVTGLTGLGLVLQLNGEQDLPVSTDGTFTFSDRLLRGSQYAVTIASQPSTYRELCALKNASGRDVVDLRAPEGSANITNVKIACGVVSGFVYSGDYAGEIFKYGVHPTTGALLPLGFAAVDAGHEIARLIAAPNGAALYAVERPTSTVRAFSIEPSTGELSAVGAPVTTGIDALPDHGVVHPSGRFLYVFNRTGKIVLLSIDPATGALQYEREVAASVAVHSNNVFTEHLAVSPNGSYLYVLNYVNHEPPTPPPTLTTYAINSTSGSLVEVATIDAQDATGLTMDPLGRFLYLRDSTPFGNVSWPDVTVFPYSINPTTGAVTPNNVTTLVPGNHGSTMVVHPSGRYAYVLGPDYVFLPSNKRIDAFAIDPSSGALTVHGAGVLTPGSAYRMVIDSAGRFVFAINRNLGTYDTSQVWCDGSTFAVSGAGPTEGQILGAGNTCSIGTANTSAIAFVD